MLHNNLIYIKKKSWIKLRSNINKKGPSKCSGLIRLKN
nr:MAG TPA: hypothetical protein [Inoviridae sp.]